MATEQHSLSAARIVDPSSTALSDKGHVLLPCLPGWRCLASEVPEGQLSLDLCN